MSAFPHSDHKVDLSDRSELGHRRHQGDLFNDLVGQCDNVRWQIEAERFRGFEIDYQFELGYSQHW